MATQLSWQVTVATAGTAVNIENTRAGVFLIKAAPANTGLIYVGNDGEDDVASTTGFALSAGETVPVTVPDLSALWFDASVNGEKAHVLLNQGLRKSTT